MQKVSKYVTGTHSQTHRNVSVSVCVSVGRHWLLVFTTVLSLNLRLGSSKGQQTVCKCSSLAHLIKKKKTNSETVNSWLETTDVTTQATENGSLLSSALLLLTVRYACVTTTVYRTTTPKPPKKQTNKQTIESNFESLGQRSWVLGEQAPLFLLSGLPPAKNKIPHRHCICLSVGSYG